MAHVRRSLMLFSQKLKLSAGLTLALITVAPLPAQDRTLLFSPTGAGVSKPISLWGLDTAWLNADNVRRGALFMGKPQVDLIKFPKGNRIVLLSEGRLVNLGNATGHPSFVMSASFTNQTLAQIELYTNRSTGKYKNEVYVLPKHLDEKVARLHLEKLGVKLTQLKPDQAAYIGVTPEGPYKTEQYRY